MIQSVRPRPMESGPCCAWSGKNVVWTLWSIFERSVRIRYFGRLKKCPDSALCMGRFRFACLPSSPAKEVGREDFLIGTAMLAELKSLLTRLLVTQQPHISLEKVLLALPRSMFPTTEQQDHLPQPRSAVRRIEGRAKRKNLLRTHLTSGRGRR